jgi:hypothetical protein
MRVEAADMDFTILGTVTLERNWLGIFAYPIPDVPFFSIPFLGNSLFEFGGFTYAQFRNEAIRRFPETDAVINVTIDYTEITVPILFQHRRYTVTGIAVRFHREQVGRIPRVRIAE